MNAIMTAFIAVTFVVEGCGGAVIVYVATVGIYVTVVVVIVVKEANRNPISHPERERVISNKTNKARSYFAKSWVVLYLLIKLFIYKST